MTSTTTTPYPGSGFTADPVYTVQAYLASRWSTTPPDDLVTQLSAEITTLGQNGTTVLQNFLAQYGQAQHLPQDINSFIAALVAAVPGWTVASQGAALKSTIENTIKGNLSLENSGFDQATIAAALGDPSLQPNSATFYTDVYDMSFKKFLTEFNYTGPSINGTNPTVTAGLSDVNTAYFGASFGDFFVKFASVMNTGNTSVNFQEIYDAFFGNNNTEFTAFLANFINSTQYPSNGTAAQPFLPNEEIGAWMNKVEQSYAISLTGSGEPTTSSVGNSFKGVEIINTILALIIKIIGTLQRVAAFQSDTLQIQTQQQTAYTNLETAVPVFTAGDGTIFSSTTLASATETQQARDQGNNYNQTLTETIRSRRTTIEDNAKVQQSDIDNSNNAANDQSSTATAFLQTITTILASIFR